MRLPLLLAITLSALGVVAAYGDHIVHERRDILPDAWSKVARLGGQEVLPVRIGLAQSNLDKGHDLLMEMYLAQPELHLTAYAFANPCIDRILNRRLTETISAQTKSMTCLPRLEKALRACVLGWSWKV